MPDRRSDAVMTVASSLDDVPRTSALPLTCRFA